MPAYLYMLTCNRHSATVIDDQIVIFGGWDAPVCYNDAYVLDLMTMDFERLQLTGEPPSPRSYAWMHVADRC